jgi:hypothetical protein
LIFFYILEMVEALQFLFLLEKCGRGGNGGRSGG